MIMDSEETAELEIQKRHHLESGTTPHKPSQKKVRQSTDSPRSRKTLAFSANQKPGQDVKITRRVGKVSSPLKHLRYSPNPAKKRATSWQTRESRALVEYIALYSDNLDSSTVEWPKFGDKNPYWGKMGIYIKDTSNAPVLRSDCAVRKQTFHLKRVYLTVEAAEDKFGLTVDGYLDGPEGHGQTENKKEEQKLSVGIIERIRRMSKMEVEEAVLAGFEQLENVSDKIVAAMVLKLGKVKVINALIEQLKEGERKVLLDSLYLSVAKAAGIDTNPADYATLSIEAMKRLQTVGKNNQIYKYAQCIALDRPDGTGSLMPLNRMPFGLVEYCIEFFSCTNTSQISVPRDYEMWHETMATEFPGRFHKLFAGPLWSGLEQKDVRDPLKARTNVPCTSKMTQCRKNKKSPFDSSTNVQAALLDELKVANPKGRFWIKLDGTDCKEALMESQRGEWNGDVDLGNGTVTDGEFCSLRTRGENGPLHIWQLIHDVRESVQKMTANTLRAMLVTLHIRPDGSPAVRKHNPAIPQSVILQIHDLQTGGMSLEDAVTYVRGKLVPDGYSPYPFRRNVPVESFRDKLQSIVATYIYRHRIAELKDRGFDFSTHLYVPEIDSVTGVERHDRSDHNHVYKRMAKHVRDGGYQNLNYEAFDDVLKDSQSGLTHAALTGKRKQSLIDAERLLSYHVVSSLRRHGHEREASHVEVMVQWHDATDGRGLSQLTRCRYNYHMLNFILDEWMPWHRECYDFSYIDINRPVENIRGFSRETVIEVTSNIESQELRRCQNNEIGYEEHPRAGGTDDLETFYSITHRDLGPIFTLKQFKSYWPNNVREFTKRIDTGLPFYYCTSNERFRDEEIPSFDECPEIDDDVPIRSHPLRLRRLRVNQREDSSIFVCARSTLPARHKKTIRQSFHKPEEILPNPFPQPND